MGLGETWDLTRGLEGVGMAYVGGASDSKRISNSGGNSRSLKACWVWFAEKGIEFEYWVDILGFGWQLIVGFLEGCRGMSMFEGGEYWIDIGIALGYAFGFELQVCIRDGERLFGFGFGFGIEMLEV